MSVMETVLRCKSCSQMGFPIAGVGVQPTANKVRKLGASGGSCCWWVSSADPAMRNGLQDRLDTHRRVRTEVRCSVATGVWR